MSSMLRAARHLMFTSGLLLAAPLTVAQAQDEYNPLPDGLRFAAQVGLAWSTLTNVEPPGTQQFSRHRSTPFSLRLSHNLGGPFVGFVEGGSAERGAQVRTPGEVDADFRTKWWELTSGISVVGQCVSYICPALDAGVGLSRNRQSVLYSQETGRPLSTVDITRYETSGVVGVRVAIPKLRGLAIVVRHHEGFSNLLTNGTKARSRSQQLMLSLPLTR